jgi:site-specific recombinase XerD
MQKVIDGFLQDVDDRHSDKTLAMYRIALRDFVAIVGSDAPLTKQTYTRFLRHTSTMNPSTQALYRSAIKGLYLFAADENSEIETTFFEQTNKRLAVKPGKRLILFNREGIEKILTHCDTMRSDISPG